MTEKRIPKLEGELQRLRRRHADLDRSVAEGTVDHGKPRQGGEEDR
jgi:hypothetical protein